MTPHIPPHWTELARCTEVGTDLFFPEKGESSAPAKRICRACEVRPECLDYALDHSIRFGVWGGTSDGERRRIRRQERQLRSAA